MRIRRAVAADAPEVTRVYVESWNAGFPEPWPRIEADAARSSRWRAELASGPTLWWVAESDDVIVGFVGVRPVSSSLGELDTIAVDPGHWRSGVGRALMFVAFEELARFGEGILWTIAGYAQGLAFYEALGWVPDGGSRADGGQVSLRWSAQGVADQRQ